ncbi:MAG TPA: glycosyltransferase family 4 protein [Longimicrobiales bacterium]|nr:glycosyltransferase family 4 protein [Longimicrobiales bacterium]
MRVLALAPYPESAPSTRFRLMQFRAALDAQDVALELHPFLSARAYAAVQSGGLRAGLSLARSFAELRRVVSQASRYDVVLIQRALALLFDQALLARLARSGVPLVYDFDDAVFLPQEGGRWWLERARDPRSTTAAFCHAAGAIFAGNDYLADFARGILGAAAGDRVHVIPSVVDTDRLAPAERPAGALPTLGWVGSDSTLPYLESLAGVLRTLADRIPHRLLVVAGRRRPRLPGVAMEFQPWSAAKEAELLGRIDVGLYPLDDTPWTRGKCGFKALQYLACAVPCVASPVGVLPGIVRGGETGLLASSPDEWVQACARLLGDAEERARLGAQGRALVVERYSVSAVAPVIGGLLRSVGGV